MDIPMRQSLWGRTCYCAIAFSVHSWLLNILFSCWYWWIEQKLPPFQNFLPNLTKFYCEISQLDPLYKILSLHSWIPVHFAAVFTETSSFWAIVYCHVLPSSTCRAPFSYNFHFLKPSNHNFLARSFFLCSSLFSVCVYHCASSK